MVRVFSTQVDVVKQTISSLSVNEVIASSESAEYIKNDQSANVASGGTEVVNFLAPAGYIYEVLGLTLKAPADGDWASGSHKFLVRDSDNTVELLEAESNYTTNLEFRKMHWLTADSFQRPSTEVAQIMAFKGLRIDSSTGLQVVYFNDADAAQELSRWYRLWVRKVKVS